MKERQRQLGRDLGPCDCETAQQQLEKRKRILSSHAFHLVIRENLSKKCSSRFIRESHQPELEHTPMPEPITAKGNETP